MRLAIVTGANKGIGHGIVELLLKNLPSTEWHIYLTARDVGRGQAAVDGFVRLGFHPKFHQLDITDEGSRAKFSQFVKDNYPEGIDILVNNAGILYEYDSKMARDTLNTNYFATIAMCLEFLPLMRKKSRLVNVSSMDSTFALREIDSKLYQKFTSPMKLDELDKLMKEYVELAERGEHLKAGWPESAYGVSKLGCTKGTFILAEMYKDDQRHILINCCCPGYVDTDMTHHLGPLTILQGADTPFYLATLPEDATEPYGQYVSERRVRAWKR